MSEGRPTIHTADGISYGSDAGTGQRHGPTIVVNQPDYNDVSRARMTSSESYRNSTNLRPSMTLDPPLYENGRRPSGNDRLMPSSEQSRHMAQSQSSVRRDSDLGHGRIRLDMVPSQGQRHRQGSQPVFYTQSTNSDSQTRRSRRSEMFAANSAHSRSTSNTLDNDYGDQDDRYVVPAMPMPLAVFCCILNFLVPGLGSMVASVSIFCCAQTDDMSCGDKCGSCCTVFGIGLLQLLLVVCFLIGWIWSCIWGITFIGMSESYYSSADNFDERLVSSPHQRRSQQRASRGRTPLPAPEVVVDQPYPGIGYDDLAREQERRRRERRARSRISLTPSNFIYPMRAPSNIAYNSPPPPYREREQMTAQRQRNGHRPSTQMTDTIFEEQDRR